MINKKSVIAIIPARGGSKGLPGKNIRDLCGKPLIAWSIETARNSLYVDVVLVSTDSPEIAAIALEYKADIPFLRPVELAGDKTPTIEVVEHALDWYHNNKNIQFDITVLLEPTSPIREDNDIDNMLLALDNNINDYDAIISVGEVTEHPSVMKRLTNKSIEPFCAELSQNTRRQDNEPAYFPYGVGYIIKTSVLLSKKSFYPEQCMAYPIKRFQNYEIDDLYDFLCVECIMKHEWGLA